MDYAVYIGTAVFTITWSLLTYIQWAERVHLREDSGLRFTILIAPSTYFLLIALSSWEMSLSFRLDLIGLIIFDAITILAGFFMLIGFILFSQAQKKVFKTILSGYHILSIFLIIILYSIKLFPPLLIITTMYVQKLQEVDLLSFSWIGMDPESKEQNIIGMFNKVFIALLSYVPISILRFIYTNHQRAKLQKEINIIKKDIQEIRERLNNCSKK